MKIFSWRFGSIFLAACGVLSAQQGSVAGPLAGFVFDSAASVLRPVQGVPGASVLGSPIGFGFTLSAVYVAPGQDSAVVVGADQSLHFFQLNSGAPTEVSLGGLTGAPQQAVFSPSGTAVALIAQGSARILTGLPSSPTPAATMKVPFEEHSMSWALSDDGNYLLTVYGGGVRLLSTNGMNRSLLPAQASALVTFAAGGYDAAVVDSLTGVTLIKNAVGAAATQVLASPDQNLAGPAGLAFSRDEENLYVASATAQSVAAFGLAAGSRTAIACGCTPATLVPMGNLFRLTEPTGTVWLLDSTSATPRTVFVSAPVSQ